MTTVGNAEALHRAYEFVKEMIDAKEEFIAKETNDGEDEPKSGYHRFDETVTDYNYEIGWRAEGLVAAVAEFLGIEE